MPQPQRFYGAHPCFIANHIVQTAEFYRDKLGFSFNRYWGEPPCFVMLARGDVEFFFSAQPGAQARPNYTVNCEIPWDAYVNVEDIEALHEEFKSRGVKIVRGPETMIYCQRELEIEDCNGYVICFAQDVSPAEPIS